MMEVVAENYHNIWAKKKKNDLGIRGDSIILFNHCEMEEPEECSQSKCEIYWFSLFQCCCLWLQVGQLTLC